MRNPTIEEQLRGGPIVYYDAIPDDVKDELRRLEAEGKIRIERDDDRVGWSRTGIVYRVTRKL